MHAQNNWAINKTESHLFYYANRHNLKAVVYKLHKELTGVERWPWAWQLDEGIVEWKLGFKIIFHLFDLYGVAKLIWVSCGHRLVLSVVPFVNVEILVHQTALNILLTLNSIQLSFLRFHWLRWIKYSNMRELGTNFHLNFVIAPNTWKCFLADLINYWIFLWHTFASLFMHF